MTNLKSKINNYQRIINVKSFRYNRIQKNYKFQNKKKIVIRVIMKTNKNNLQLKNKIINDLYKKYNNLKKKINHVKNRSKIKKYELKI